jgi:uncharacterized membrane protein YjfL (UPF0719 family)
MSFFNDLISRAKPLSTTRFCLVFSFLFVTITPFSVWAFICIYNRALSDLPTGIITFSGLVLGIITSGKAIEKISEGKKDVVDTTGDTQK